VKIYNKDIPTENINFLIQEVKKKKELNNFSEQKILDFLEYILKRDKHALLLFSQNMKLDKINKNKVFNSVVKKIREDARRIYGVYITKDYDKKEELLKDFNIEELLKIHVSTKERIKDYEYMYKEIIKRTINPKSILDLGCGLNPISKKYISDNKIKYIASDLNEEDVLFINDFIKKGIEKKCFDKTSFAFRCDLTKETEIEKITQDTDWCLLLKVLDPVEEINENITYKIINKINSKWIICSFPTLTVSRKKMKNPKRNWFEKVLDRSNLEFNSFELENELFYIINNNKEQKK